MHHLIVDLYNAHADGILGICPLLFNRPAPCLAEQNIQDCMTEWVENKVDPGSMLTRSYKQVSLKEQALN